MRPSPVFEVHISTKNRKSDLLTTLTAIAPLLAREDTSCVVYDDGSTDGTFEAVSNEFPKVHLKRNEQSKGYMFCRNAMLDQTHAEFAISLDDDAHFLSQEPFDAIRKYFNAHALCGVIAFRIFWGKDAPVSQAHDESPMQVNSYVGCGHAWRVSAWREIPSYPEWFEFYGEENFASLELFKKEFEVHYVPQILVQHRVDLRSRKKHNDYSLRLRRSLRSGWYSYFLFLPLRKIPAKITYSIWSQLRLKVFTGDLGALKALVGALSDLVRSSVNISKNANRMTPAEYDRWTKIPEARIYWKPKSET